MQYTLALLEKINEIRDTAINTAEPEDITDAIKDKLKAVVLELDTNAMALDIYTFIVWTKPDDVAEDEPYLRAQSVIGQWKTLEIDDIPICEPIDQEVRRLLDTNAEPKLPTWDDVSFVVSNGCNQWFLDFALTNLDVVAEGYAKAIADAGWVGQLDSGGYDQIFVEQYQGCPQELSEFFRKIHDAAKPIFLAYEVFTSEPVSTPL